MVKPHFLITPLLLALLIPQSSLSQGQWNVGGILENESGDKPSNVKVILEISDRVSRNVVGKLETQTGMSGEFSFDVNEYNSISQLGLELYTVSPRFQETRHIEVISQEQLPFYITMTVRPGSVATGLVTNELGEPLERALVTTSGIGEAYTDSEGRYELYGLPGRFRQEIMAEFPGYSTGRMMLSSESPALLEGIDFTLSPAATLSGTVTNRMGETIGDALVEMVKGETHWRRRTYPDGRFDFRAAPVDLAGNTVVVTHDEYLDLVYTLTTVDEEKRSPKLVMEWPVRYRGRVLYPDGSPAIGAIIVNQKDAERDRLRIPTNSMAEYESLAVKPGEEAIFLVLPANTMERRNAGELDFTAQDNDGQWAGNIDPWPQGFSSKFSATLKGNNITMKRQDEGLGALPGDVIYSGEITSGFAMMEGTIEVPSTGAVGTFQARKYEVNGSLRGVWDLRETIGPGTPKWAPSKTKLQAPPMAGVVYQDMVLDVSTTLSGTVVTSDGSPAIEGTVRVLEWEGTYGLISQESPIAAGGAFELKGMPRGVILIGAFGPEGRLITAPTLARGGVRGFVLGASEDPVDGIE